MLESVLIVRSVMRHGAESRKKVVHCRFESYPDYKIKIIIYENGYGTTGTCGQTKTLEAIQR